MKRAALLSIAAAMAFAPAAAGAGKAETTVTIDSVFLASGQTHWAGDIESTRKDCKDGRSVLIFRKRSGPDEKIGKTKSFKGLSDNGYYWTYYEEGAAKQGKYYAKVKATDKCEGDRSTTLEGPS
jgi:hypothetical protein